MKRDIKLTYLDFLKNVYGKQTLKNTNMLTVVIFG